MFRYLIYDWEVKGEGYRHRGNRLFGESGY